MDIYKSILLFYKKNWFVWKLALIRLLVVTERVGTFTQLYVTKMKQRGRLNQMNNTANM